MANSSTPRARVLVVEDSPTNRELALVMLEALGCSTDTAENGRIALPMLDKAVYDIIFMDCLMPEMDGFETTRAIRERSGPGTPADVPIVGFTAEAFSEDRDRCLGAGMNDYVSKPAGLNELTRVLDQWVPRA